MGMIAAEALGVAESMKVVSAEEVVVVGCDISCQSNFFLGDTGWIIWSICV